MNNKTIFVIIGSAVLLGGAVQAGSHWNGGRTVPVHLLAPRDAEGEKVSPTAALPRSISQQATCGQCHEVEKLEGGTHFRTGLVPGECAATGTSEPWFWGDEKTGTAIPLSLRGQKGAYSPADINITCWEWTKLFGRAFPGGGVGCSAKAMSSADGARQRWGVTGALEPNCLACHQQGGYDSSEWARQVLRENWQGAATAASGIGQVEGMNERLSDTWSIQDAPENPDDHLFRVPEKTVYNMSRFDAKGRCTFAVGKPRSENCLACHAVSEKDMPSHSIAGDVHLKRGMTCVDCHTCGIDHRFETKSCASCHMDPKGAGPVPVHAGIPLVHFEKLACTVCHSGVTGKGELAQVRTSRANRIGIYGRAQWAMDTPYILEPVFVRNAAGKVEPRRISWPCGFYRATTNNTLRPIPPAEAAKLAGDALTVVERVEQAIATVKGNDTPLGEVIAKPEGFFYRSATNELPVVAKEERFEKEHQNLCATVFNANVGAVSNYPAFYRGGELIVYNWKQEYEAIKDVKPAEGELPLGYLSADRKKFIPLVDKWSWEQYFRIRDTEKKLTKEIIRRALANAGKDVRYVACGLVFSLDDAGKLVSAKGAPEAAPVSWAFGHDVRPARQARGANPVKCADCHTSDSQFFLGSVSPMGPILDLDPADMAQVSQSELLGVSGLYHSVLGQTFSMRPLLKVFLWTVFGLMCLFAVAAAAAALLKLAKWIEDGTANFLGGLCKWVVDMGFVASVIYLFASGAIGWWLGGMSGWWLVLHMVAGGGFAASGVLIMAFRARERSQCFCVGTLWMLWTVLAAGTVFTAVMPMMTVFGGHGQEVLLWCHRCTSICFAAVSLVFCRLSLKKR